jgi:hypothetical protein
MAIMDSPRVKVRKVKNPVSWASSPCSRQTPTVAAVTAAAQLHLLVEGAIVRAVSGQREMAAASARAVAAVLLAAGGG